MLPATAYITVVMIVLSLMTAYYAYACHMQADSALRKLKAAELAISNQRESICILQRDLARAQKSMVESAHELHRLKH